MRTAYLECFSGISGDMFLGALVDAGVPLDYLAGVTESLHLGVRLEAGKVTRGGITGTKVDVITHDTPASEAPHAHQEHAPTHAHEGPAESIAHKHEQLHEHSHEHPHTHEHAQGEHSHEHGHEHHRSLAVILGVIRNASISGGVKQQAIEAFQVLGEAEAAIHSIPVESVHFHEVGAVDTIVDIVCAAAGAEYLGVDRWLASPLNVGSGTVHCAHGILPVPAPATLKLLGDAPVYSAGPAMERVTPTGATILRMLHAEYAPLPSLRIKASGYGAGGRDTPGQPNLVRLLVGEEQAAEENTEPIAIVETVIDDSTPQLLSYVSDLLLQSGAWDVYRVPVQMKKGRTGVQLTVLCRPDLVSAMRDLLFRETSTIGLHWRIETKMALQREFTEVQTTWGAIKIKVAHLLSGAISNAAPEYEDCRRIAEQYKVPLKQVTAEAMRIYASVKPTQRKEMDGPDKDRGVAE